MKSQSLEKKNGGNRVSAECDIFSASPVTSMKLDCQIRKRPNSENIDEEFKPLLKKAKKGGIIIIKDFKRRYCINFLCLHVERYHNY